eukprot:TRINITY_DN9339_c1_g1_i4.p1 TRINITY_DN9339_c1_g1~~TRINITY_DN9339_c1_g1_i4.p1  ORF type:complete len:457 (+),score=201.49 TRINITY_DN9339_c1_g1_i4:347-1717(+)
MDDQSLQNANMNNQVMEQVHDNQQQQQQQQQAGQVQQQQVQQQQQPPQVQQMQQQPVQQQPGQQPQVQQMQQGPGQQMQPGQAPVMFSNNQNVQQQPGQVQQMQQGPGQQQVPFGSFENSRSLYVGNLSQKVSDGLLYEVFSTIGPVESCKIIKDKNGESAGYGFVDFYTSDYAKAAMQTLNGKKIYLKEIKVNWAFAGTREDTSGHSHIFVGDLSPDIDDTALYKAFQGYSSISDARVMWDNTTGRSRGYGFVAFRDRGDAERAITEMSGVWLGSRAIRCNWANQKNNNANIVPGSITYAQASSQASPTNTTVYVGNLGSDVTEDNLRNVFSNYGRIEEIRIQKDKNFGFVRYATHDQATRAIVNVHGTVIVSKPVKCSWGKERIQQRQAQYPSTYSTYPGFSQYNLYPSGTYYSQYYGNVNGAMAQSDPAYGSYAYPDTYGGYAYPNGYPNYQG